MVGARTVTANSVLIRLSRATTPLSLPPSDDAEYFSDSVFNVLSKLNCQGSWDAGGAARVHRQGHAPPAQGMRSGLLRDPALVPLHLWQATFTPKFGRVIIASAVILRYLSVVFRA